MLTGDKLVQVVRRMQTAEKGRARRVRTGQMSVQSYRASLAREEAELRALVATSAMPAPRPKVATVWAGLGARQGSH